MLVLPGGQPGATHLRHDARLKQIIEVLRAKNCYLAAICAAPTVLSGYGILKDRSATSHPTVRTEVAAGAKEVSNQRVIVDGPIITSQAAGTAMEFVFKLVEILCGTDKATEVNLGVLARL
jgi:4-methyl-5(b-hydroxyethyl)-thiazole monophosphate biosynthesis